MESLKKNEDFKNCYHKGRSYANRFIVLYVWENGLDRNRVGISASKKVGNSVVRHHFCRLVRESYRLHEDRFNSGLDLVVVARSAARSARYADIESALMFLAGKANLLRKQEPAGEDRSKSLS